MISYRGRNQLYQSRKVILQSQNVLKELVAGLEPLPSMKKVVMKNLVRLSSMYCFSQRSKSEWLVIDSATRASATERFEILLNYFQRRYSEILLFPSKDR
jgi:hypothetical protein